MRIGLFSDTYIPQVNGVVTVLRTLKAELEKRGHEVFVFTVDHPDAEPDPNVYRIPSVRFPQEPQHRIGFFLHHDIVKRAKAMRLDIIHSHSEFSLFFAAKAVEWALKIPGVHTLHTFYEDYVYYVPLLEPFLIMQLPAITRNLLRKQACVIAPSRKISLFLKNCKVASPVEVVPNGIDLSTFYERSPETVSATVDFRAKHGISADEQIVVFVGRLAEEKNISALLRNWREIRARRPKARLVIVGDGPDRRDLVALARNLGVEGSVVFTGYLGWPDEIKVVYAAASLFMSASHSEVHPITFIEAMASGLPVVASADPSIEDMVLDGQNGWAVRDDRTLWEKAVELLSDPVKARAYGARSEEISRKYSVDRFVESMERVYERYRKR